MAILCRAAKNSLRGTIVVLLYFIRKFVQSYAVCAEMGGWAGHPEEQQREADQRAPGVHLQCGGVEATAPFLQGRYLTSALQESTFNVEEWKRQLHSYRDPDPG